MIDEKCIDMDEKNTVLNIGIRGMVHSDIDEIYAIETSLFSDAWPTIAFAQCMYFNENYVLYQLDTNEIVGYMIGQPSLDEYSIYNIAIKSCYHRKGYASYLLNFVMALHEKKYTDYYLEVRKSNEIARAFYEKLNFQLAYIRKNYYSSPPEDALILRLQV